MRFGIATVPTDYSLDVVQLGRQVEAFGFESLFFPEHSHVPVQTASATPSGRPVAREYEHALDQFVALTAVAVSTSRLLLGTGICLVVQRDPIQLAKEVASLDYLSGGRFLFGVGGGWNREEMRDHGTAPEQRWDVLRERLAAMKEIWASEVAEFHGRHVDFGPMLQWPKPVQRPHPPILLGGDSPSVLARAAAYADGWMPVARRHTVPLADKVATLRRLAAEAGRKPPSVTIFRPTTDERWLERYRELGIERCVFWLPPEAPEPEPILDGYARVAERFG